MVRKGNTWLAEKVLFLSGAKSAHSFPTEAGFTVRIELDWATVTSITLALLALMLISFLMSMYRPRTPPEDGKKRRYKRCSFCGQDPPDHPGRHCKLNPDNIAKEAAAEPQGDGKNHSKDKNSLSAPVAYGGLALGTGKLEWFADLTKSIGGRLPRCQSCLKRVTTEVGFSLCTLCSSWICSSCFEDHEKQCSRVAVMSGSRQIGTIRNICTQTCVECCQMVCGMVDCSHDFHHVCGLCMLRAIDQRHPATWSSTFVKDHPTRKSTLSYDDYKLSVMRIFQMLKDPKWFTRNSAWLVGNGVDRWNNFQRCYNKECISECPKSLALIYAATKVFQKTLSTKWLSTNPVKGRVLAHSTSLWKDLLSSVTNAPLIEAVDLSGKLLQDGSSALGKLLTVAEMFECELINYSMQESAAPPAVDASTSPVLARIAAMQLGQSTLGSLFEVALASVDKVIKTIVSFGIIVAILAILMVGLGDEEVSLLYLT